MKQNALKGLIVLRIIYFIQSKPMSWLYEPYFLLVSESSVFDGRWERILVTMLVDWIHVNQCKCVVGFPLTCSFHILYSNILCCVSLRFAGCEDLDIMRRTEPEKSGYCTFFCLWNYSKDTSITRVYITLNKVFDILFFLKYLIKIFVHSHSMSYSNLYNFNL